MDFGEGDGIAAAVGDEREAQFVFRGGWLFVPLIVFQVLVEFVDVGAEETAVQLLRGQASRYRGVEEIRAKRRM